MRHTIVLPPGELEIPGFSIEWRIRGVDSHPPQVELIASIATEPTPPPVPLQEQTATTVAIRMDARVAIHLYRRIGLIARSMGWSLPP